MPPLCLRNKFTSSLPQVYLKFTPRTEAERIQAESASTQEGAKDRQDHEWRQQRSPSASTLAGSPSPRSYQPNRHWLTQIMMGGSMMFGDKVVTLHPVSKKK